jgi:tetratricopeptide (TPR) repeat protein
MTKTRHLSFLSLTLFALLAGGPLVAAEETSALDKKIAELEKKVEANPNSHLAHLELGKLFYENGRSMEAMVVLKAALDIKAPQKDAPLSLIMINLGQVLETERQLRLAIQVYETALKELDKEERSMGGFGPGYREALQEYMDKAKASKDKAIKHFETADKMRKEGKRQDAVLEIQKCLALAVDFGDVWRVQGEILAEAGHHQPAVISFQKSLELFARDPQTLTLMGRSLLLLRKNDEAAEAFRKALLIDPANTIAIDGLQRAGAPAQAQ